MDDPITRLYPLPNDELPLKGAYLAHDLYQYASRNGRSFVFSNYVTSLDGRIAIPHPTTSGVQLPENTANSRDWRLFQELVVQSDVLITSGRYLRDYAEGRAQDILNAYTDPRYADLGEWRAEQGLSEYPDLAVISNSLDFSISEDFIGMDRSVFVFTSKKADPERIKELEKQMGKVIIVGKESVLGDQLVASLSEMGYKTVFNTTGPKVLHLLLVGGVLDRLYLTFANRLLGGSPYSSIVEGSLLDPPADFTMSSLYFDPYGLEGLGQLFATYDRATR